MDLKDRRVLRRLSRDPDRWWDADMQRKAVLYWLVRRLCYCFFITVLVVFAGIYLR